MDAYAITGITAAVNEITDSCIEQLTEYSTRVASLRQCSAQVFKAGLVAESTYLRDNLQRFNTLLSKRLDMLQSEITTDHQATEFYSELIGSRERLVEQAKKRPVDIEADRCAVTDTITATDACESDALGIESEISGSGVSEKTKVPAFTIPQGPDITTYNFSEQTLGRMNAEPVVGQTPFYQNLPALRHPFGSGTIKITPGLFGGHIPLSPHCPPQAVSCFRVPAVPETRSSHSKNFCANETHLMKTAAVLDGPSQQQRSSSSGSLKHSAGSLDGSLIVSPPEDATMTLQRGVALPHMNLDDAGDDTTLIPVIVPSNYLPQTSRVSTIPAMMPPPCIARNRDSNITSALSDISALRPPAPPRLLSVYAKENDIKTIESNSFNTGVSSTVAEVLRPIQDESGRKTSDVVREHQRTKNAARNSLMDFLYANQSTAQKQKGGVASVSNNPAHDLNATFVVVDKHGVGNTCAPEIPPVTQAEFASLDQARFSSLTLEQLNAAIDDINRGLLCDGYLRKPAGYTLTRACLQKYLTSLDSFTFLQCLKALCALARFQRQITPSDETLFRL